MKRIFMASLFIVSIIGCKTNNQSTLESDTVQRLIISPSSNKHAKLSDVIEIVKIIKLESNEKGLIGSIDKLRFFEDKIFMYEEIGSRKLLCYDINGKFLFQVGAQGRGEGEYSVMRDININPWHRRIELYDVYSDKIMYYNLDGEYIGKFKLDKKLRAFTIIDSLHYGCFNDAEYETDLPYNFFVSKTSKFSIENKSIPFLGQRDVMNGENLFYEFNDNNLFVYSLNDTIYDITANGATPKFALDFGENKIPEEILQKSMMEIVTHLSDKTIPGFLSNLAETSKHLSFSYTYDTLSYNTAFLTKENGEILNLYQAANDINYLPFHPPSCTYGDNFVSIIPAYEILEAMDKIKILKAKNPEKINLEAYSKLEEIALGMSENDNPILLVYKII